MSLSSHRVPKHRIHKPSGRGVVTLSGKDRYTGEAGTKASRAEYDRLIAEWLANGRQLADANDLTVLELVAAYWTWAETYYHRPEKGSSGELECRRRAREALKRHS